MKINVYLRDDRAFIQLNKTHLLCIGSKAEVDKASDQRVVEMVWEALAYNQFLAIDSTATRH